MQAEVKPGDDVLVSASGAGMTVRSTGVAIDQVPKQRQRQRRTVNLLSVLSLRDS
jgi:hypothetical protein